MEKGANGPGANGLRANGPITPVPYATQCQCHNGIITTLLFTFNFFITSLTVCRLSLQDNNDNYEPEYNNVQSRVVDWGVASLA